MAYQNITASLSPADVQEIKAAFATIQAKMPFLVTLSAEERRNLFKMGDKISPRVRCIQKNFSDIL
ncbi:hypothetical protein [Nostoc sp.]|uniref:hypothetical protein n=1 Tax=Nostoc sp. TaxID=1180 RepID=UPI002FFCC2ED